MTVAVAAGGLAAWYKRSEGKNTIDLLKTNIEAYKTSEAQHLQQIVELQAEVKARDRTITELRATMRNMVKEFKEYKNG